jgi:phage terminase large subunit
MNIVLDEELFNPLKFKLDESKSRFNLSYGSAGSGKSFTQAQHEIIKCLEGNEKTLIIRKYGTTLKDSVVSLITTILDNWGLQSLYTHNKSDQHIRFINGSEMLFKGFDDPEKIKSIAGITRVWIEEATELTKDDFNQINLRVRGRDNLQITLTFNPIDEDHWIKSYFFDTQDTRDRTTILHTTYKDNQFIDEAYKQELESYRLIDPNYYKIYALGQWGGLTEGRIFQTWLEVDEFPDTDGAWYGLDFGYSNDPTAIVKTIKINQTIYVDEICYRSGLTNSDIAGLLKSQGYLGELVICDSAEPKSVEELRRMGINAAPANKGQGSINSGIDFLKRSTVLITKRSVNIRKENRYYQWQQTKDGRFINTPKDFQNHIIDSLRYAYSYQMPDAGVKPTPVSFQVKN